MKRLNLLAIVLFLGTATMAQNHSTIQLTKGKNYQIMSTATTESKTNYQGQNMETKIDVKTVYNMEVADVANGQYKVNNTLKSVKMSMNQMGMDLKYDSDDSADASSPLAEGFSSILNKTKSLTLDNGGNVVKDAATAKDAQESAVMEQLAGSGFGTEEALVALPVNVKAGDTWTTTTGDTTGTLRVTHYTVKSVENNVVNLDYTGEAKTSVSMESQGMQVQTKTSGTFSGNAVVEKSTGIVQSSRSIAKATGNIEAMGMEMPTESNVTTETTVKEL